MLWQCRTFHADDEGLSIFHQSMPQPVREQERILLHARIAGHVRRKVGPPWLDLDNTTSGAPASVFFHRLL